MTLNTEDIAAASREKWEWGKVRKAFGRETVSLHPIASPLLKKLFPGKEAYRILMVNRDFVFGSGSMMRTASCIAGPEGIVFFESDSAIQDFLPALGNTETSVSAVCQLVDLFSQLRGYEIQVGFPTETDLWNVPALDGKYPRFRMGEGEKPWDFIVKRTDKGWSAECILVSPDDFRCVRYVFGISDDGKIESIRTRMAFKAMTHM